MRLGLLAGQAACSVYLPAGRAAGSAGLLAGQQPASPCSLDNQISNQQGQPNMPTSIELREVQSHLLVAIRTMTSRAEAYAKDKEADQARDYAEAAQRLAEAWAALTRS